MAQENKVVMLHNRYALMRANVDLYNSGAVAVVFDTLTNRTLKVVQKDGIAYVGKVQSNASQITRVFGCNINHTLNTAYKCLSQQEQKEVVELIKKAPLEDGKRSITYTMYYSSGAKGEETKLNSKGEKVKVTLTKEQQREQGLLNSLTIICEYYGKLEDTFNLYNGAGNMWNIKPIEQKQSAAFEVACKLEDMQ